MSTFKRLSASRVSFRWFPNRVDTRVILKCYGDPISKFSSARQLLCSLRDAIEGHKRLLENGVLNRDVSIQNILRGSPRAEPGDRGILIDLDMAIRYGVDSGNPTDWRIGTCLYQSVMVLSSRNMPEPLVHDHLDDLESFLYVLTYVIHVYDSQGVFHSIPNPLQLWNKCGDDHGILATLKESFLAQESIPMDISSRWPDPCLRVFHDFRSFIQSCVHAKIAIIHRKPVDGRDILKSLRLCAEDHYDHVLRLFDEGIAVLEKAENAGAAGFGTPPPPPPASTSALHSTMQRSPLKRSSDDYPDAQPAAKRPNPPRIIRNPRSPR
ncbi:hypothetical protein H1R20_g9059, partial [Candolleomyces eurysporus]